MVVVPEVLLENQVLRVLQAMMVHLAHLEKEDLKDLRVQSDFLDQRAPLDQLVRMGCLVTLGSGERLASKERLVLQALAVWLVHRGLLVRPAPLVREVILAPLVLQVSRVYQELLEKKALRETQVPRVLLAKTGLLDCEDFLVKEVCPVPRVQLV